MFDSFKIACFLAIVHLFGRLWLVLSFKIACFLAIRHLFGRPWLVLFWPIAGQILRSLKTFACLTLAYFPMFPIQSCFQFLYHFRANVKIHSWFCSIICCRFAHPVEFEVLPSSLMTTSVVTHFDLHPFWSSYFDLLTSHFDLLTLLDLLTPILIKELELCQGNVSSTSTSMSQYTRGLCEKDSGLKSSWRNEKELRAWMSKYQIQSTLL